MLTDGATILLAKLESGRVVSPLGTDDHTTRVAEEEEEDDEDDEEEEVGRPLH